MKRKILVLGLLTSLLVVSFAIASADETISTDPGTEISVSLPPPDAVNADLEIFRITSASDSEAVGPRTRIAENPIKEKTTILSSALVWGEKVALIVDGNDFCGLAATRCDIRQEVLPGAIVTTITFDASELKPGYHAFTVAIYPMPGPGGYTKTVDSIAMEVAG